MDISSKIYYAKPSITDLEKQYIADAAAHGWGDTCYDYIFRFEEKFQKYIGVKHALATSSCTGALHLGLAALGIGPGDEVIVADTNWIASVAPIIHLGAKPVFVDILPDTWCLDPDKVNDALSPQTKAILAVHLYGNLCAMTELEKLAQEHHLALIEDAAEAVGSGWGERRAGSRGVFGVFSFHGTKTLTTGEGGMLVTNDDKLYERAQMLNNHGRKQGDSRQFWAVEIGYKYKMSNIQAALGCAQLERIEELTQRRRAIFFRYHEALRNFSEITMNPLPKNEEIYGYWMPTLVFSSSCGVTQLQVLDAFKARNIDGRAFFSPLSQQAYFQQSVKNVMSMDICQRAINLPSYHDLKEEDFIRVITTVEELLH